jgi:pilus assembly protein CpaE
MERRALIIAGAAEPADVLNTVLRDHEFAPAEVVPTLPAALARIRNDHFDLVIVPLDQVSAAELALLERDIPHDGSTNVVGTARKGDTDSILTALRAGLHEFLTSPLDATELSQALERLARRWSSASRTGKVIAIYSPKGGLGNTTVAINLAYAFAREHPDMRAVVADFVAVGGDVRVALDLHPSYDIGDLAGKVNRLDGDLLLSLLTRAGDAVWALPSSDRPDVQDLLDGTGTTAILAHLRAHFALVVADTEHHLGERTLAALDAADRVLLVTQLTVPALRTAQATLRLFSRLGYPDDKVQVVVNRFDAADGLSAKDAVQVLGREIFWKLPNDYHGCAGSLAHGKPIVVHRPDSGLARAFAGLAERLTAPAAGADGTGNGKVVDAAAAAGRFRRIRRN